MKWPLTLYIHDSPNIVEQTKQAVGRPRHEHKFRFGALARWLVEIAGSREIVGAFFHNATPEKINPAFERFLYAVEMSGFHNFVRPKNESGEGDIDEAMLEYIDRMAADSKYNLEQLVVASHDGRCFREPLTNFARAGVEVYLLGFPERSRNLFSDPLFKAVDIRDVDGLIVPQLPKYSLHNLPPEGMWFEARGKIQDAARAAEELEVEDLDLSAED